MKFRAASCNRILQDAIGEEPSAAIFAEPQDRSH
jgi:hypothetical protein